jgi:succinate dehydrogenase / fumarate reductase iron-sulfur subunit
LICNIIFLSKVTGCSFVTFCTLFYLVPRNFELSINTGSAPDANLISISKPVADEAMDAAECIGCGACVAACPNASAALFVSAKIWHLAQLPQGQPERKPRATRMIDTMDVEGFGNCSNHGECEAICPKGISISNSARMRREYIRTLVPSK